MKEFLITVAIAFALVAGTGTVLMVQLTRAAAQTLTVAVTPVTVVTGQAAKVCRPNAGC